MSSDAQDLFAASESYLNGDVDFDRVYQLAIEALPELHTQGAASRGARLAALVVAMEAESSEFTDEENRARLRDFLAAENAVGRRG